MKWVVLLFLATVLIEIRSGGDLKRYRSPGFRTDVVYSLFYASGVYIVLVYAPIMALIGPRVTLGLIALPPVVSVVVFWLCQDMLNYWLHRWSHSNRFLWAFHQVHHSQKDLTALTQFRFHLVDQMMHQVVMYIPLLLVFGVPVGFWTPVVLAIQFAETLQHADLRWHYGPFRRLLVSPVFHSVHHSTDPGRYDHNFGMTLSIWDFLFGTAYVTRERERSVGLVGWSVPESFLAQLVSPFRALGRQLTRGSRPA